MASLMFRSLSKFSRGVRLAPFVRSGGSQVFPPHEGKVVDSSLKTPDGLGHAVGNERWEMLQKRAGVEDPFQLLMQKRGVGTFEQPTLVASQFDSRTIGCVCDEDAEYVLYMDLHRGEKKRCKCGYWYALADMAEDGSPIAISS